MTLRAAISFAAVGGFISLSYEILWFRVYSYITGGSPITFGLILGLYLAGIAVGSDLAGKLCRRNSGSASRLFTRLTLLAFLAAVMAYATIPLMAASTADPSRGWLALFPVAVSAALFGALLPLISHLAIAPTDRAGKKMSYLYFSNIVGSVTGSLMTGFILTDVWTTAGIALFLALAGLGLAGALLLRSMSGRSVVVPALGIVICAGAFAMATPRLLDRLYERLQFKDTFRGQRFAHIVENRHGVVAVSDSGVTFGGGAYDGRVSTSLVDDRNGIERAFAVLALHPRPRRVLVIGLSTGAWSQVIANSEAVESVTIVEINPGYLELMRQYPEVSGLFRNPKVRIVIDDGRRWLVHHPGEKFDLIVSNTTFHHRANTTNLLSKEFLKIVRSSLLPGGIFHFNTTGSQDAMKTAFSQFRHGLRVLNFVAVSDSPIVLDSARWRSILLSYRIEGRPVFDLARATDRARFEQVVTLPSTVRMPPSGEGLETRESVLARIPDARIITDDNMLPEWHTLVLTSGKGSNATERTR